MKRSFLLRVGGLLLVATLATGGVFMSSPTYAKYVARATYAAAGRVALFDVYYSAGKGATAPTAIPTGGTKFSQADCAVYDINEGGVLGILYEADCVTLENVSATANPGTSIYNHVNTNDGSRIAPGTGGRIGFHFRNNSEVAVRFYFSSSGVAASATSNQPTTMNIQYAVSSSGSPPAATSTDWNSSISSVVGRTVAGSYVDVGPKSSTTTPLYLYWRWPFGTALGAASAQDQADTQIGIDSHNAASNTNAQNRYLRFYYLQIVAEQID